MPKYVMYTQLELEPNSRLGLQNVKPKFDLKKCSQDRFHFYGINSDAFFAHWGAG